MTFLREVGRDGGSPAKRSWVLAEMLVMQRGSKVMLNMSGDKGF